MRLRLHPTYDRLSLHADGELPASDAMEVNAHLASCERCRGEVDFMIDLRARLRELAVPGPPSSLLSEILDRSAAGERRVLPLARARPAPESPSRVREGALALALALGLGLASLFAFDAHDIRGGATSFELDAPRGGRPVDVRVRTAGPLAGESILRVRGEYFTAGRGEEVSGTIVEGVLRAGDVGEFEGDIVLPSSASYARFVVEDYSGSIVERDYAEGWEYLDRNADGLPTFDALWLRAQALQTIAPREAQRSARRITELYPDRPEGWNFLFMIGDPDARAEAPPVQTFLRTLPAVPRPAQLTELARYAGALGDGAAEGELLSRLQRLDPRNAITAEARIQRLFGELGASPRQLLRALEDDWREYGQPVPAMFQAAVSYAVRLRDVDAASKWADRWVAADPTISRLAAEELARLPALRSMAEERFRAELARLDGPTPRPLGTTRVEQRRSIDALRADALRRLGALLAADGRWEAAVDTLTRAVGLAWDPDALGALIGVSDRLGDREAADRYRLRLAADPLLDPERRRELVGALTNDATGVPAGLAAARRALAAQLLPAAHDLVRPTGPIPVTATDGRTVDLSSRLGATGALVQFWSPRLGASATKLERLVAVCDRLLASRIRLIAVSLDPVPAGALPEGAEGCAALEVYVDLTDEALTAFRARGLADGILVDRTGQIRGRHFDETDGLRAALLLDALD